MLFPSTAPREIRVSFVFWLIAIVAGVFETLLVVFDALSGVASEENIAAGVAVRLFVFTIMTVVIVKMGQGKNWARIVLAIGLGILGLLSLLISPIEWLMEGHSLLQAFEGLSLNSALFFFSRVVHITAVLAGLLYMFLPAANRYFKGKNSSST